MYILQVEVTDCMSKLIKTLAYHMHEGWAHHFMTTGWIYDSIINFDAKTHSGLRPFSEIESKDCWEIHKAETVVLTLAALGCTISQPLLTPKLKYIVSDLPC